MNIQHSSRTDEWATPGHVVEMVKEVLGPIDLDPASSARWNARVGAASYYDAADDGLTQPWTGTVYINPPGGKRKNRSLAGLFWEHLMDALANGSIRHAIFMAFSAEALQTTQRYGCAIMDFPFCVPAKRLQFVSAGVEKFSPSHSSVVVYVPGTVDATDDFARVFRALGRVKL